MTIVAVLLSLSILAMTPPRFRGDMAFIHLILVILTLVAELAHPGF